MTLADIRNLLDRLDEGPADALESEVLEFKSWVSVKGRGRGAHYVLAAGLKK